MAVKSVCCYHFLSCFAVVDGENNEDGADDGDDNDSYGGDGNGGHFHRNGARCIMQSRLIAAV